MEKLKCKACRCYSMIPLDVAIEDENDEPLDAAEESRFFTCHVCGDNWLSVKESGLGGDGQITFIHQMGMEPTLRRVGHVESEPAARDLSVGHWDYYLGEDIIEEREWMQQLTVRRATLRSICCN